MNSIPIQNPCIITIFGKTPPETHICIYIYTYPDRQRSLQRLSLQIQPSNTDYLTNTSGGSTPSSPSSHARENAAARRLQMTHQRRSSALVLSSLETLEEVDRSGYVGSFRERRRSKSEIEFDGRR